MLGIKRIVKSVLPAAVIGRVSNHYREVPLADLERLNSSLSDSWKSSGLPTKQRNIVDKNLEAYRSGRNNSELDALVDILKRNVQELQGKSVLEIGCSSGYYSEVFKIKGINVSYTGCDYSDSFIEMAKHYYPDRQFDVENAVALSYESGSYDVVISGACLLHIYEFEKAIAETARVSNRYAVFHRTPVLHLTDTSAYTKKAYGVPCFEIHFNEQELVRLFGKYGLDIIDVNSHAISWDNSKQDALVMKTYMCEKIR